MKGRNKKTHSIREHVLVGGREWRRVNGEGEGG
jgi:hypothetical protein